MMASDEATLSGFNVTTPNASYVLAESVGNPEEFEDTRSLGLNFLRTGLKFDLATLPLGAVITSAMFNLTTESAERSVLSTIELGVNGLASGSPMVSVADYFSNVSYMASTGPLPNSFPAPDPQSFRFDVTALARSAGPDVGFLLISTGDPVFTYGIGAPSGFDPTLDITYSLTVPEPSSAMLCGLAGSLIVCGRRVFALRRPGRPRT